MWAGSIVATLCEMTSSGPEQPSLKSHSRPRVVALAFAGACLAVALLASGSSAGLSGASTPLKLKVKSKRLAVDPRTGQVEYRLRATNRGTQASGVVRLCAGKWPRRRLRLRGERCEAAASIDPGQSAVRVFRFRVRARARGKLSKIRLRARGPNFEAVGKTVRLRVRRRAGASKIVIARKPGVFLPEDVTVRRGERLIWESRAVHASHTVTFCSAPSPKCDPRFVTAGSPFGWGEFNEGLAAGGRIARTAMRRGKFHYYCRPHGSAGSSMHGSVTVK